MSEELEQRLVVHALIIGAVKGALAGLLLGAWPATIAVLDRAPWGEPAKTAVGLSFAVAWLCALDAASGRHATIRQRRLTRFAAGFVAPFAVLAPWAGIFEVEHLPRFMGAELLASFVAGMGLGLGLLLAGEPRNEPHQAQGCGRLLIVSLVAPVIVFVALAFALDLPRDFAPAWVATTLGTAVVAFALWVAEKAAGFLLARRVALALEPEVVLAGDLHVSKLLAPIVRSLRDAALHPTTADGSRLDVLARLDRLVPELITAAESIDPGLLARLRAEALLGLGRLDEAETLLGRVSFAPALRAELARRRGDPEAAAEIVFTWAEELGDGSELPVVSARATAHALLALARADQGKLDEARAHAESARDLAGYPRAFEFLGHKAVARFLDARAAS
ncbi:MAG TPA: hypothetical protein VFF73_08630 [Planctomycetota bacterium]|nr:hypothetical protein [Planctomycetota bacterium]